MHIHVHMYFSSKTNTSCVKPALGFRTSFLLAAPLRFSCILPHRFEQKVPISLLYQETQLSEGRVICSAMALQCSHQFLVLLVMFQKVPDGEYGPLADERVVAIYVAVVQDEGDAFQFSHLVLVVGVAVTEVSNQPDKVGLEADDRRAGGRVSTGTEGGEILSSTENILTGLPYGVHLLQKLNSGHKKVRMVL